MNQKNCPKCNIIKSITEFHNDNKCKGGKRWCCKECVKLYYKPSKESRRKSDRCCLNCKTSHPLASFDGNGRICENCRIHRSNLVNERNEYFKKYKNECNDYIYETNPSNYEDWENRLRDYPWGFPSHLKDLFTYLTSHGKQNLYYVKIK